MQRINRCNKLASAKLQIEATCYPMLIPHCIYIRVLAFDLSALRHVLAMEVKSGCKVREFMPCQQSQGAHAILAKSGSSCHSGKVRELMPCWKRQGAHDMLAKSGSS